MRISSRGEYGVRAMFDLGQRHGEGPIPLKTIAERQQISEHYLEQLIAILRKAGLVKSVRGAQGGYKLAKSPGELTLGDIIRVLEGPVLTVYGTDEDNEEMTAADSIEQFALIGVWKKLAAQMNEILDSVTLADLTDEAARMKSQNDSFMYHI